METENDYLLKSPYPSRSHYNLSANGSAKPINGSAPKTANGQPAAATAEERNMKLSKQNSPSNIRSTIEREIRVLEYLNEAY